MRKVHAVYDDAVEPSGNSTCCDLPRQTIHLSDQPLYLHTTLCYARIIAKVLLCRSRYVANTLHASSTEISRSFTANAAMPSC